MASLKISIVTPCLNSRDFIDRTIRSVTEQNYDNLEYIIADGGSTDGSLEIIGAHGAAVSHVLSEPDRGHYDALNKGFSKSTGEVMGWLNSNDIHFPWTLSVVSEIFAAFPEIEWATTSFPLAVDLKDRVVSAHRFEGFGRTAFWRGQNMPIGAWRHSHWIQQEGTFWRRSLWERAGARLEPLVACDFELWARFFTKTRLYAIEAPLAGFRLHRNQRSQSLQAQYNSEARAALLRHGGRMPGRFTTFVDRIFRKAMPTRWRAAVGLAETCPVVSYVSDDGRWQLVERHI
jgi:glycosyltransferase involved in cell wall biosynthesis